MYSTPEVNSLKTNAKHIILNPIIAYTQHSLSIANPRKMWSHLRERGQWLVYVVEWTFRGMWKGIRYHIRRHVGCHASSPQSQGPGALCYEEHFLHEVLDIGWRTREHRTVVLRQGNLQGPKSQQSDNSYVNGQLSNHWSSLGAGSWLQPEAVGDGAHGLDTETDVRSEEHTSELQSRLHLVCRLLLEKKKKKKQRRVISQS